MTDHENILDDIRFHEGQLQTVVDLRLYRLTAVQKAAYRFANRCTVHLGSLEGERLSLAFLFSSRVDEPQARDIARLFFQEVLDQELREQLREETAPIRALLLAQAFSKTDLIQR